MRTSQNAALATAPIGAVSLLPYFNLKSNDESSIQADSFITKAKAALNYYEKNVTGNGSLHEMYYLGDDFTSYSYNNCDGGDNQMNDAHLVEVLAALSVVDFDGKQLGWPANTNFHEFGLGNTPNGAAIFADFGNNTKRLIQRPLTIMSLLNSYLNNRDDDHRRLQKWAKERNELLGDNFFHSDFFSNYDQFKNDFERWQEELSRNQVGFKPFKKDSDIKDDGLNKVVGVIPKYKGFIIKKKGYDLIDIKLGEKLKKVSSNLSGPVTFMELFYNTLSEICTENLNIR